MFIDTDRGYAVELCAHAITRRRLRSRKAAQEARSRRYQGFWRWCYWMTTDINVCNHVSVESFDLTLRAREASWDWGLGQFWTVQVGIDPKLP